MTNKELRYKFDELKKEWKENTIIHSNFYLMFHDPSYQAIIALDRPVLPLLFEELQREPDWWFYAIEEITGESPEVEDMKRMLGYDLLHLTDMFLKWGKTKGLVRPIDK